MNEDDTFNKLRRVPYEDMRALCITFNNNYRSMVVHNNIQGKFTNYVKLRMEFFRLHGWKPSEYNTKFKDYIDGDF